MDWVTNGKMRKKLLYKTQQVYLVYAIVIFIIVGPIFYFFTKKIYIDDIDEALQYQKNEFLQNNIAELKEADIVVWNKFNENIKILKSNESVADSVFYRYYYNTEEQENEPFRELNSAISIEGKPYVFSAKISMIESEDLILSIVFLFLGLIILLLLGLFFITKKLSLSLWKPFYETLNQIELYEVDKNVRPRFSQTSIEEFNRLNNSFENLIKKNSVIFENQREFVENAAHELQTPIAVFKGKIDVLMQRSDITEGQAELLESLNSSIARLNKLNKNLLLLSKIEKNNLSEITTFRINEIIEKQLEFFKEQAIQKNIHIETDFGEVINITANRGFTEILCSNLLLNAIQHNVINGNISIYSANNKLTISNTGIAAAIKSESLFNRFSKASTSEKGNGLGLAIVKKIADLNHWSISYSYKNNLHSFTITF